MKVAEKVFCGDTEWIVNGEAIIMGLTDAVAYAQQVAEEVMKTVLGKRVCKFRCTSAGYIRRGFTEMHYIWGQTKPVKLYIHRIFHNMV